MTEHDDTALTAPLIVAAAAAAVLLSYTLTYRHLSIDYHLHRKHRVLFHAHRGVLVVLWAALLFNLRHCVRVALMTRLRR